VGKTSIEWTDATWNPTRGCTVVSPGCKNCYAMKVATRFSGPGLAYEGLALSHPTAGGQWTGKLRLVDDQLDAPLRWQKPRRIFVNSMSDLFHEALSIEQIASVFAVMYLAPRHTFQVLTKRAARMREVLNDQHFYNLVLRAAEPLRDAFPKVNVGISDPTKHPAPWVHLGVSVESQKYADERWQHLGATPAGARFFSCEPLLARVVLRPPMLTALDWVIVGGESGAGARRFEAEWARSIVKQCRAAGLAVFVKQMGANVIDRNDAGFNGEDDGGWHTGCEYGGHIRVEENLDGYRDDYQGAPVRVHLRDRAGGDPAEWPDDLRVREFPEVPHA
jgi:protein gp37